MARLVKAVLFVICASFLTPAAVAQEQVQTAADLAREHSRKIMLKVQADAAQEELRLLEAQSKAKDLRTASAGAVIPATQGGAVYEQGDVAPVVAGVFGGNGDIYATLLYAGGALRCARRQRSAWWLHRYERRAEQSRGPIEDRADYLAQVQ